MSLLHHEAMTTLVDSLLNSLAFEVVIEPRLERELRAAGAYACLEQLRAAAEAATLTRSTLRDGAMT